MILTKTKNAVQGTMRLIPCDVNGKVDIHHKCYESLDKEVTLYYYIGKCLFNSIYLILQCHSPW